MRSLPLIFAAVLVLLAPGVAGAAPSQAPNQNGGSGQVPAAPNQNGGSGSVPAAPTAAPGPSTTPVPAPIPTATAKPAPRAIAVPAPVAPGRTTPTHRSTGGLPGTVKRFRGCLPDVTRRQARVLVLRGSLGRSKPTSRAAIAQALDLSVARVVRLERQGVRSLRARASTTGCAGQADEAAPVVRDAVAALRSGGFGHGSKRGDPSDSAVPGNPQGSGPALGIASGTGKGTTLPLAALTALVGLALIARGLRKESPR